MMRIVDPDTATEKPAGMIGEVWVHGENVSSGYWRRPAETEQTFMAQIQGDSSLNGENHWLRTGDLGFISEGELFIVGRIKDLLIVRGRNHYPDDIEATIREISGGRVAAIAAVDDNSEKLVAIVEFKAPSTLNEEAASKRRDLQAEITSAISKAHGLSVEDVVLVAPGSIPITTSGKVRRATCVEFYESGKFRRLDVASMQAGHGN